MNDFWRRFHEEGVAAIPSDVAALSPLAWAEVEELHPERVPAECAGCNPLSSPLLIRTSPFVREEDEDGVGFWAFEAEDPVAKRVFDADIDYSELFPAIGKTDYFGDEGAGILTCGCGVPGCAGIWSQTCHVSRRMVHWTVRETGRWTEWFFERKAYERGLVEMLHEMVTSGQEYSLPYLCECEYKDWGKFVAEAQAAVERCPHLLELWEKCGRGDE
ncbi:MAG: hypothetical protein IK066_05385 [Kiritimatiellae bacterium]|nr:hypothetical protein [Kiritimatiellia bacterium]